MTTMTTRKPPTHTSLLFPYLISQLSSHHITTTSSRSPHHQSPHPSPLRRPPLPIRHDLENHLPPSTPHALGPARIDPPLQILALAHVEELEVATAFDDCFDAGARDAHTPAHREVAQLEEVQRDAAEGGVGDGGAAEGEVEVGEHGEAQGEDFGRCVGKGAAEGLAGRVSTCVGLGGWKECVWGWLQDAVWLGSNVFALCVEFTQGVQYAYNER